MVRIILGLMFLMSCYATGVAQQFEAAYSWASHDNESMEDVVVDDSGYVYVVANFTNAIDLAHSANSSSSFFNFSRGQSDFAIVKIDPAGNRVWSRHIGNLGDDYARSVAVDREGNVYVVGGYTGAINFDEGVGSYILTPSGNFDAFLAKYDNNGALLWAKRMGSADAESAYGVAVDTFGNVYTTGHFYGNANFNIIGSSAILYNKGQKDVFVTKHRANGDFVWAKQIGGSSHESAQDIATDLAGNVIITGQFEQFTDFNPSDTINNSLGASNASDAYVCKLDSLGDFVWAVKTMSQPGYDYGTSVKTDLAGNIYCAGYNSNGTRIARFQKRNPSGGLLFEKTLSPSNSNSFCGINDIAIDQNDNIYATGYYAGTVDFDPSASTKLLASDISSSTASDHNDIFIAKYNTLGAEVFTISLGGSKSDKGACLVVDQNDNIYTTGTYESSSIDFDLGAGSRLLSNFSAVDAYSYKLSQSITTGLEKLKPRTKALATIYPNPTDQHISIDLGTTENATIQILDAQGHLLQEVQQGQEAVVQLNLDIPAGLYFARVLSKETEQTLKFIKN